MQPSNPKNNGLLPIYISATELYSHGVMWADSRGVILGVNTTFARQIGMEADALTERMVFEVNPHLSIMAWRKLWKQLLKEKQVFTEAEHLTVNDELIPVKVRWELVAIEEATYACAIVEDLIASSRYKDLLNIASDIAKVAAWEWDVVHGKYFFTPQFNQLFNLPDNFTLDKDNIEPFLSKMLTSKSLKALQFKATTAIKTGEPFKLELDLRTRGTEVANGIMLIAKPLVLEDRTVKIYGTVQDVSHISGRTDEMYLTNFCMEYAQECILWLNEQGQVVYCNQAAALTYDYLPEEFKSKTVQDFIPRFRKSAYEEHWEELLEYGMLEYESIHARSDGSTFPVWLSHNYIDYQGKAIDCLFLKDLTDQKIQEDRWKLTQFAVDHAREMIFWIREDGHFEYVNNRACEILEYTQEEIFQIDPFSISDDFSKENWLSLWESFKKDKYFEAETNYYTKSGKKIPVIISASLLEFQDKVLCCSFVRDLNKKKKRDEQIKLSMSTIEFASDMVFWLDKNARIFYANQETAKNLGYRSKELEGISLFKIAPNKNKDEWAVFWKKIKTQKNIVEEGLMKRKNGKVFPVEVTMNYIVYEGREMLSNYAKDITRRKAKALKLELAYEEIKQLKEEAEAENIILKDEIKLEYGFKNIISNSERYKGVLKQVEQVADSDATVLILGETGTGKELLARAVHELSNRSEKTMIKINCSALPANLIESELFGHEKGAFSGAHQMKKGRFELAHRGTIFLDEIGELPLDLQAKLLRVLQEGEFERVGGNKTIKVDVRVIAATNRNLEEKVNKQTFREDLFYRLNVFPIYNIPLRERKEDIAPLVRYFVDKYSKKMGKKIKEIPQSALKKLEEYNFPGNIRELENIVERSIILTNEERLSLDTELFRSEQKESNDFLTLKELQRNHIIKALKKCGGKVSGVNGAAALLEINDKTLTSRMKKLKIARKDYLNTV